MSNPFHRIAELVDQRRTFVLASVASTHGSTPQKAGARMIVFPDLSIEGTIGGGAMEEHVKREAAQLLQNTTHNGCTKLVTVSLREGQPHSIGGICGGDVQFLLERFEPAMRLIIFGGGHCGRVLAKIATEVGYRLVVFDDREDYADPKHLPAGCQVIHAPFEQAAELTQPQPTDAVALMTYAWPKDEMILKQLIGLDIGFLGMIGSKTKCERVFKHLLEDNTASEEQIKNVNAPIGLDIGAHMPEEVAISILGQIIQWANRAPV